MRPICIDTRKIKAGDIFIPVKGQNFDGHDFIPEALKKGATVLDVDLTKYAKQYRKKLNCYVIAITGSAGKTTVKDLLAAILSQKFNVIKTQENENNEIGVPLTILKADFSTEILIIEMGMRKKGEIAHLAKIANPTHSIITSTGLTHIEILGSEKAIAQAKSEIFQPPKPQDPKIRYGWINYSSPFYKLLKTKAEKNGYTLFPFNGQDRPEQNLNLCYQVGHHFGLSDSEILQGLKTYESSAHRLKKIQIGTITIIDDTYNANPDGVGYSLDYIRRFNGRKLLVLGDMLELGAFSSEAHQNILPQAIDAGISLLYTLGPAGKAIQSTDITHYGFLEKSQLNDYLLPEVKEGDTILIKGSRSMKMEETVDALKTYLEKKND